MGRKSRSYYSRKENLYRKMRVDPEGNGRYGYWRCPVCGRRQLKISMRTVTRQKGGVKVRKRIARFRCGCGFEYEMEVPLSRVFSYVDAYNWLWDEVVYGVRRVGRIDSGQSNP